MNFDKTETLNAHAQKLSKFVFEECMVQFYSILPTYYVGFIVCYIEDLDLSKSKGK